MTLADFMTETFDHYEPDGTGVLPAATASDQACTPLDPLSNAPSEDYPTEKVFLLRETFTKYAAIDQGDILAIDSVNYIVIASKPYAAQGGLDAFWHIICEQVV